MALNTKFLTFKQDRSGVAEDGLQDGLQLQGSCGVTFDCMSLLNKDRPLIGNQYFLRQKRQYNNNLFGYLICTRNTNSQNVSKSKSLSSADVIVKKLDQEF